VGLWTAIQVLKRSPTCAVTIYERHEVYQRSHVLQLDHWSMLLYGRNRRKGPNSGDSRQDEFFQEVAGKSLSDMAWSPTKSLFIRTNDLEAAFKRYALALGAILKLQRIDAPEEVEALHPNCQHFIAADGAHSGMRRKLLGATDTSTHPLRHVVEVKYQVRGPAARLKALPKQFAVNRKLKHLAFEYVGKEKNGLVPVTLRFFLSEEAYSRVPQASFKEPLSVDDPGLDPALRADIAAYMSHRTAAGGELYCQGSGKVTKLVLSLYSAREFAIDRNGRGWFITGDAALGVPYFRALNSGMILSSRLAQILCAKSWPIREKLSRQLWFYRVHRPLHIQTEFAIARGKDFVLDVFDLARQVSGGGDSGDSESGWSWAVDCREGQADS
jgi:2-polyprenyl-6-methoxyphenol hydroxylase-like FAD-dependent oxidoreductase